MYDAWLMVIWFKYVIFLKAACISWRDGHAHMTSEANACTNVIAVQQEGERDQGRGKVPLFILWTTVKMSKELAKAWFHDNYLAFLDKLYTPSFWKVMVGCSWSVRGECSWQNQTLGATWILMHAKLGGIMGFQRNNHLKRAMSRLNKEKRNLITTNISFIPSAPQISYL